MPSRLDVYWCRLSSGHLCFDAHSCQKMELKCRNLLIGINGVCSTWRYLPKVISHGLETLKEGRTTGILCKLILFDHLAPAISTTVRGYLNFTPTIWMRCMISVMPRENTATMWLMQHAGNNTKYADIVGGPDSGAILTSWCEKQLHHESRSGQRRNKDRNVVHGLRLQRPVFVLHMYGT